MISPSDGRHGGAASAGQPGTNRTDRGRAQPGIALEAVADDMFDRRIEIVGNDCGQRCRQTTRTGQIDSGLSSRKKLVEHEPECVHVSVYRRLAPTLLGCHVVGRASDLHLPLEPAGENREAEVHDLRVSGLIDHQVGWLQIPMQDPSLMCCLQTVANLQADRNSLVLRQAADPAKQRCEIFSFDI
jgi:hypothetical protein